MSRVTVELALARDIPNDPMANEANESFKRTHAYYIHGECYFVACDRRRVHGERERHPATAPDPLLRRIGDIQGVIPAPDNRESFPLPTEEAFAEVAGLTINNAGAPLIPIVNRAFNAVYLADAIRHVAPGTTAWVKKGSSDNEGGGVLFVSGDGERFAFVMPVRRSCGDLQREVREINAKVRAEAGERFKLVNFETIIDAKTGEKYAGDEKILGLIRSLEKEGK